MSTTVPFIRNAELLIGPLAEDQGGGATSEAFRLFADGSLAGGLRIRFSVSKTILGAPNISRIEIYNMSRESRARIRTSLTAVRLNVGWANAGLRSLVRGGVLSAVTSKQGPDIVTTLNVMDGYGGQVKGVVARSYKSAAQVSDVVRDIAGTMPGVGLGEVDIAGRLGPRGRAFSGRSADELDKLAHEYGFSWSVQDGVFQAVKDDRSLPGIVRVSNQLRNLISAQPILSGPMQIESGVDIEATLDARTKPGARVQLESGVNPDLNGTYKIHNVDFSGDTHAAQWSMRIQSLKEF